MRAGFTDLPIENLANDILEVKDDVKSIAEFVSFCETPMTIAIQGDWGSGKTSIMSMVKNEFKSLVEKHVLGTGRKAVFFMDDLDRIRPVKAVEVLEAVKNLMDIEGCVFVLAVDYEVIVNGIKEKYGGDLNQKGRNFFDKIIQVPFHMPVSHYKIDEFVRRLVEAMEIKADKDDTGIYTSLIENSISGNVKEIIARCFEHSGDAAATR